MDTKSKRSSCVHKEMETTGCNSPLNQFMLSLEERPGMEIGFERVTSCLQASCCQASECFQVLFRFSQLQKYFVSSGVSGGLCNVFWCHGGNKFRGAENDLMHHPTSLIQKRTWEKICQSRQELQLPQMMSALKEIPAVRQNGFGCSRSPTGERVNTWLMDKTHKCSFYVWPYFISHKASVVKTLFSLDKWCLSNTFQTRSGQTDKKREKERKTDRKQGSPV